MGCEKFCPTESGSGQSIIIYIGDSHGGKGVRGRALTHLYAPTSSPVYPRSCFSAPVVSTVSSGKIAISCSVRFPASSKQQRSSAGQRWGIHCVQLGVWYTSISTLRRLIKDSTTRYSHEITQQAPSEAYIFLIKPLLERRSARQRRGGRCRVLSRWRLPQGEGMYGLREDLKKANWAPLLGSIGDGI